MNNKKIELEIEKYRDCLFIVEGIKDKKALESFGLMNIFVLNKNSKSLLEKVEEIEEIGKNKKICILTDFDKEGKKLYLELKSELARRNVKLDSSFRSFLLDLKINHIEDLKNEN